MECTKCGSKNIRVWVEIGMYIDPKDLGKINKKIILKKTTELWSMDYKKVKFICLECCYEGDDNNGN